MQQHMPQGSKTYEFTKQRQTPHNAPVKSFRSGALQVAIWENENIGEDGQPRSYKTVSFERRYKDPKSGEWKSSNQLRINDLPKAALILSKAYEYMVLTGAEDEEGF
jgi:hypothetical protein